MSSIKKTRFRGKFKFSLCSWLRMKNKTYIIEGNYAEDDKEEDTEDDWDTGDLINGNKQVSYRYRRPGVFSFF